MLRADNKNLVRMQLGGLPLLHAIAQKLDLRNILSKYLPVHGNETISAADTMMLLIYNLALGKSPLYKLENWANQIDRHCIHLEQYAMDSFSDDRFGRALDKLYQSDRASLMTELVMSAIKAFNLQTDRIHNDSTSVKAFGEIPGKTKSGLELRHGHSKDHRPDLKQLVYTLSISADGAVPIHCKIYPGNRTDDTTHIETWNTLHHLCGKSNFLYVADSKVCTDNQLDYIESHHGRVVTIMPKTWKEVGEFKNTLRAKLVKKIEIWRRQKPGNDQEKEYFSCFEGDYKTHLRGYQIHWIFSSSKKDRDQYSREDRLKKTEAALMGLSAKINKYYLKEAAAIEVEFNRILKKHQVESFIVVQLEKIEKTQTKQIGKGRPTSNTQYQLETQVSFTLKWHRNLEALKAERRVDGVFPLLSTDGSLSAKEVLQAYKYQPMLENRFSQFKSIHNAAPLFFKSIERIEANMFAFFISLMLQGLLEREIRNAMKKNNITSLDIYPEDRESKFPTTNCIMNTFDGVSRYKIMRNDIIDDEFKDALSETQTQILGLLQMSGGNFWND